MAAALEATLREYEAEEALAVGPPHPLPYDEPLGELIARLGGYVAGFEARRRRRRFFAPRAGPAGAGLRAVG